MDAPLKFETDAELGFIQTIMRGGMDAWLKMLPIYVIEDDIRTLSCPGLSASGLRDLKYFQREVTCQYGAGSTIEVPGATLERVTHILKQMILGEVAPIVFFATHHQSLPCVFSPTLALTLDRSTTPWILTMSIQFRVLYDAFLVPEFSFGATTDPVQVLHAAMIQKGFFIARKLSHDTGEWEWVASAAWHPSMWVEDQRQSSNPPDTVDKIADTFERARLAELQSSYPAIPSAWRISYELNDRFALWRQPLDRTLCDSHPKSLVDEALESVAASVRYMRLNAQARKSAEVAAVPFTDSPSNAPASATDSAVTLVPLVGELSLSTEPESRQQ